MPLGTFGKRLCEVTRRDKQNQPKIEDFADEVNRPFILSTNARLHTGPEIVFNGEKIEIALIEVNTANCATIAFCYHATKEKSVVTMVTEDDVVTLESTPIFRVHKIILQKMLIDMIYDSEV